MNLAMLLDMAADAFGERIAVTCGPQSLTYSALRAGALAAAGQIDPTKFSHAVLLDTNGLPAPLVLFASAYAGVPYVPLNYRLTGAELEQLLQRVAPAWLVSQPAFLERLTLPAGIQCADAARWLAPGGRRLRRSSRRAIRPRWPCSCSPAAPPEPPRPPCCGMKTSCPTFSAPWSSPRRRRRKQRSWPCRRTTSRASLRC